MAVIDLSKYIVTLSKTLMAENKISVTIGLPNPTPFNIGDIYVLNGETYKLNRPAKEIKGGPELWSYFLELESQQYELNRKLFLLDGNREFTIVGNLEFFIDLVLTNINTIDSGWTKGTINSTSDKNLTFTDEDCRSVLNKLATEFESEFEIVGKEINFPATVGSATGLTFQYGKENGLYKLTRQNVDSKNTVTRVYGFGSTQNLPNDYRGGLNRLVFDVAGNKYLEDTSEYPDIVEGQITFDNIKPSFEGPISAVSDTNNITITVPSINFDLEAQLNPGQTAKVQFNSGDLLGQVFEILDNSYDNGTKTFTLVATDDQTGTTYPNATFKPQIGDLITFLDIHMPQSYIDDAEDEVQTKTQAYLDENKKLRVVYDLLFDYRFENSNIIDIGDTVTLIDTDFNINRVIRITSINKKFANQKLKFFTGKISDYIVQGFKQRLISKTLDSENNIVINEATSEDLARRNTLKNRNLKDKIFDPDDFFDVDNIRPLSIETLYLSIGAKSQNFRLSNVTLQANYAADENRLVISTGTLFHRVVERISPAGSSWIMSAFDQNSLTPATDYFLYAKCSKTATTGVFILDASELAADPGDGFYYFWVGILYAVVDNVRDFDLTNGMTYINGRTITTGKIRSLDELNYFDLDNNKFKLGDANSQLDWNVSAANQLRIKGTIVQNPGGSLSGLAVFRGAYSGIVTYYKEDTVTNDGSTWRYINVTPSSGNTPAEDTFWTVEAAKGEDGTPGTPGAPGEDGNYIEYQYAKNGSTTVPPSIVTTDLNPAGWSITPPTIGALEYLWLTKSTKNAAGDTLIIDWSTPVRIGGVPGEDGTDGTDGTDGVNARSVNLISGVQGFNYDTNGLNPSPSSTTVTATALNTTGTVYYEFLLNGVSVQNTTSNTYSYSPQADYGDMPDKIEVRIREGASVGDVLATDQMTLVGLKAGENAITVVLSNEAHTLPTNNLGVVIYDGSGTNINVWEGTTQLTVDENAPYDNSTFRVIAGVEIIIDFDTIEFADFDEEIFYVSDDTNITPGAASGDDGSNTRIYGDASAMTEDNAYIPFIIIVTNSDGVEFIFTKIQSFAKSIEGDTGDTGDTGPSGPLAMGGSDYNAGTSYHGNSVRVDIVKYLGVYYVARSDAPVSPFDGIVPTNTAYWNSFGATFDSVATDLLFATLAYIENLGVRYLRTATSGQRVEIDGTNNVIKFYNSSGVLSAVIEALGSRGYIESNLIRATELLYLSPIASVPGGVTADNYFWQDNSGNLYFVNTNGTQTQIN